MEALGYSSCFLSALNLGARTNKLKLPENVKCDAHVSIGPPAQGSNPFAISVDLFISSDAKDASEKEVLEQAVKIAHEVRRSANVPREFSCLSLDLSLL